jgi:hypothetical protein
MMNLAKLPFGVATLLTIPSFSAIALPSSPPDLAQAQNLCPQEGVIERHFETQSYHVYVCSGTAEQPKGFYVGVAKSDGDSITLPLVSREAENYVALNDFTYYSVDPTRLQVSFDENLLVDESVIVNHHAEKDLNFPNFCEETESLFVIAETQDFWVNICGSHNPYTYVGVNKNNGNQIRLPLSDYDRQGDYFEATNGDVSYLLIRGTAKGDFLTVTAGTRELVRQPILRWD